jgi:tetratricopeptide (TPR) repeat protein
MAIRPNPPQSSRHAKIISSLQSSPSVALPDGGTSLLLRTALSCKALVLVAALVASSPAQTLFQNDALSVRSIGLGGTHLLGAPDPFQAVWHPAVLGALREHRFLVNPDYDFNISTAGLAGFWPQAGGWGLNWSRVLLDDTELRRLSLGWGIGLNRYLSTGVTLHGNRLDSKTFATASVGLIVHPQGGPLAVSEDLVATSKFGPPLSPYRFALSLQASDLPFNDNRLEPYYKAGLAWRTHPLGPSLFVTQDWQHDETSNHLGLAYAVQRLAVTAGLQDFNAKRAALGASLLGEAYAFDFSYSFADERFQGGLTIRLGASSSERAQQHFSRGMNLAKTKDYRSAYTELRHYRVYEPLNGKTEELIRGLAVKVEQENQRIQALLDEAQGLEKKHEYLSAAINYLNVLKLDRNNRRARQRLEVIEPRIDVYANQLYQRGVQAYEEGNYDFAQRAFEDILLVRKNHEEAEHYLSLLADYRDQQAHALFLRGLGYYSQSNFVKAQEAFEEALRYDPHHAEAQSYVDKAQKGLEQQAVRINRMMAEGLRLEKRQQYLNAYKLYQQVLDLDPNRDEARLRKQSLQATIDNFAEEKMKAGERAFLRGDYERANREFQAVLTMMPNHQGAKSYRQRIEENKRGRVEEHMRNAMALFDAQEWRRAAVAFERVLEIDDNNKLARRKRNEALSKLGLNGLLAQGEDYYNRGQFANAMEMFDRVLAQDPDNAQAKKYLDQAQRQLNYRVEQYFNRGLSHYANEDYDNAIREWNNALALNPNHAQSREYREQARLKQEALERLITP